MSDPNARSQLQAYEEAAHGYVDRFGFAVFPIAHQTKRPIVAGGFKAATKDHTQITSWWSKNPRSGIGIATGAVSGIVVLDQDPRNGGEESYLDLRSKFGTWGDAPMVLTGSGGTHEYFRHPRDGEVPCRTHVGGFQGIDIKGDGGYIVAPPSVHPNGKPYVWDVMFGLEDVVISDAPDWLIGLARQNKKILPTDYERAPWNGKIPDKVAYAVAVSEKVARRFHRDPRDLCDCSPSGIDASLGSLLARFGCDGSTIEAGIRASRAKAELPAKRDSYYAATTGSALTFAKGVRERD